MGELSIFLRLSTLAQLSLRKNFPYSELFWSIFSSIRTEYGEIQSISPYSARKWENADQNISEYGHFSHSASLLLLKQVSNLSCTVFCSCFRIKRDVLKNLEFYSFCILIVEFCNTFHGLLRFKFPKLTYRKKEWQLYLLLL